MAGEPDAIPPEERQLRFQVVTSLSTSAPWGAESYLRWIDAEDQMVPTMAWLPDAARSGALTRYSIAALPDWTTAAERLVGLSISFNTSGHDLLDDHWLEATMAAAARSDGLLALEVPHVLFNIAVAQVAAPTWDFPEIPDLDERLAALREAGIGIWLDDYGDTYYDEAIFEHPEIDIIKLDRTFLGRTDAELATVVEHIHANGKIVILEGLETAAGAARATEAGVDLGQGFHLGWPMTLDEFAATTGR